MKYWSVSTDVDTILDAVSAVMSCIPRPWTHVMVSDAIDAVLDVAHQWQCGDCQEVSESEIELTFLTSRLGLSESEAYTTTVVAE